MLRTQLCGVIPANACIDSRLPYFYYTLIVSFRQNGVGTGFSIADGILPKGHHRLTEPYENVLTVSRHLVVLFNILAVIKNIGVWLMLHHGVIIRLMLIISELSARCLGFTIHRSRQLSERSH